MPSNHQHIVDQLQTSFPTPRAAYVHVPFCRHRCGYCNFTLVAGRDDLMDAYLRAIDAELAHLAGLHPVDTLFLGGGTPTHLPPRELRRLIGAVTTAFPLATGYEFSVEANPADLSTEVLALLAELGVNRVSIGGQSFDTPKLKLLERDHDGEQLRAAVLRARECIQSVSLDLIFGTPGESLQLWQRDLSAALALPVDHVSTYGLTFERGTAFGTRLDQGELLKLDEETERDQYALAIDTLAAAGFEHYEVSNFARPGHRCRHNEVYWSGDGYYAVGPGAASYVNGTRAINHQSTTTYLKRVLAGESPVAESETLAPEERAREWLVFALRRLEGVDRATFTARTGFEIDQLIGDPLARFVAEGLLIDDGQRLRLSRAGLFVSDAIWPYFLRG